MRRRAAVLATSAIALNLLGGCRPDRRPRTAQTTAAEPAGTSSQLPPPSPAPGYAPDGTPIPGGKPVWLVSLPDPRSVDRTDPEAVIRAYVTTAATWDTTVDVTSAYATQRAAIYQTEPLREATSGYDPDTVTGQAEFIRATQYEAYTAVTIRDVVKEGLDPDQDGDYHRIVHYLVRTIPRLESASAAMTTWYAWVTATQEDDKWAIASMRTRPDED